MDLPGPRMVWANIALPFAEDVDLYLQVDVFHGHRTGISTSGGHGIGIVGFKGLANTII